MKKRRRNDIISPMFRKVILLHNRRTFHISFNIHVAKTSKVVTHIDIYSVPAHAHSSACWTRTKRKINSKRKIVTKLLLTWSKMHYRNGNSCFGFGQTVPFLLALCIRCCRRRRSCSSLHSVFFLFWFGLSFFYTTRKFHSHLWAQFSQLLFPFRFSFLFTLVLYPSFLSAFVYKRTYGFIKCCK